MLSKISEIIDQAMTERRDSVDMSDEETRLRVIALERLFRVFDTKDRHRFLMYVQETHAIPLDKLRLAIFAMIRTHAWPSLPQVAEIWEAARYAAGMHRQQYRNGHYLPAPREWPPEGKRHAIAAGELERAEVPQIAGPEALKNAALPPGVAGEGE